MIHPGAHDPPRKALALLATLLEQQQTAVLVKLLDGPTQGDTPGPLGETPGPPQETQGCCLAQALVGLADACTRNPTAGALQGVVAWPYPTDVLCCTRTTSFLATNTIVDHNKDHPVWPTASLASQQKYWQESVRLCLEALVLLRALLTNTGTGLAALEDVLATSGAARHALLTTARLQAWGAVVEGGTVLQPGLDLGAWTFRADSVERNPLLQGVQYATVDTVSLLALSVQRRVLPSIQDGTGGMDVG